VTDLAVFIILLAGDGARKERGKKEKMGEGENDGDRLTLICQLEEGEGGKRKRGKRPL